MTKIKICGLTRPQDIAAVNAAMPDYIGFVFAPSRRQISPSQAAALRAELARGITPVGVFVDAAADHVLELVRLGIIDAIQLHGAEDEAYIRHLKSLTAAPIIKAIPVQKTGDVQKWQATAADYLLLDNKSGGTGQAFNWELIGKTTKPYFLAGGLDPANISEALAKTTPHAVDTSSGVETDGLKDPEKIHDFITQARRII